MKMLNFEARKKLLIDAIELCKQIVVYVVEDENANQYRYRYENISLAVNGNSDWVVAGFFTHELKELERYFGDIKIVVIVRQTNKGLGLTRQIGKMKKNGVKVLFDLDDLVFDYRDLKTLMESVREKNFLYWMGYVWGIRRIAKKVDGFICTNGFLAEKLKRSFSKPVKIIRNSLSKEQVELSEKNIKEKSSSDNGFVIGYFSGSPTHAKDFGIAETGILKFLKAHNDAKLKIVGFMEPSRWMKEIPNKVEILNMVNYSKLQELVANVNVNIAPLVVNDFTNSKSELKFFEAAIVETTTIASPAYAFKEAITDGKNGLLANSNEWYDKLEYLYKNPSENQKIAKKAREYVLKHYYGEEFLKEVEAAYVYFV